MSEFTFFEVHFHEFSPTNTAPLLGRGGSASEVARGESADPDLDGVPVEEAEPGSEESSGGPGAGLVVVLVLLAALAVAARRFLGGDEELAELEELDEVA